MSEEFLVVSTKSRNRGEELPSSAAEVITELEANPDQQYRVYLGDSADIWIVGEDALLFGITGLIDWYNEVAG